MSTLLTTVIRVTDDSRLTHLAVLAGLAGLRPRTLVINSARKALMGESLSSSRALSVVMPPSLVAVAGRGDRVPSVRAPTRSSLALVNPVVHPLCRRVY